MFPPDRKQEIIDEARQRAYEKTFGTSQRDHDELYYYACSRYDQESEKKTSGTMSKMCNAFRAVKDYWTGKW